MAEHITDRPRRRSGPGREPRRGRPQAAPIPPLVAEWLAALKSWDLAPKTCANYGSDLRQFAEYLGRPLTEAVGEDLTGFAEAMDDRGLDARTRQRRLVAVRQFYQYLVDRGHITASPAERLRLPKLTGERIPDFLTDPEILAVRGAFEGVARRAASETTGYGRFEIGRSSSSGWRRSGSPRSSESGSTASFASSKTR